MIEITNNLISHNKEKTTFHTISISMDHKSKKILQLSCLEIPKHNLQLLTVLIVDYE